MLHKVRQNITGRPDYEQRILIVKSMSCAHLLYTASSLNSSKSLWVWSAHLQLRTIAWEKHFTSLPCFPCAFEISFRFVLRQNFVVAPNITLQQYFCLVHHILAKPASAGSILSGGCRDWGTASVQVGMRGNYTLQALAAYPDTCQGDSGGPVFIKGRF